MAEIQSNRKNILRGSFGAALATLMSRFLGLFRVIFEAQVLGGGALATAWQLAFAIPNLFRRLFGEGALAQALIPLFAHTEAEKGLTEARKQLALILSFLTVLLIGISATVSLASVFIAQWAQTARTVDAMRILPLLMPYTVFICMVGVMTAIVNTRKVFFLASLNALILNIVQIALLLMINLLKLTDKQHILLLLATGVVVSGIMQFAMLAWLLKKYGVFPIFRKGERQAGSILREIFTLALPGLIGAGASQISFLVDRIIALQVGDCAVPALNNTERLVYLPIGIVGVALASVLMANMSSAAANKRYNEMLDDMTSGLRYVWFTCAPLAVYMIFLREPLIKLLFMRGNFTLEHVAETAYALLFYAVGIPAFCAMKVILPAFYARKKMTPPLIISLCCIAVNIPLSLLLMHPLRQGGIALATVISQMLNNMLLLYMLKRENFSPDYRSVAVTAVKTLIFALTAALPLLYFPQAVMFLQKFMALKAAEITALIAGSLLFAAIYWFLSLLFKMQEPSELYYSLIARQSRKKEI